MLSMYFCTCYQWCSRAGQRRRRGRMHAGCTSVDSALHQEHGARRRLILGNSSCSDDLGYTLRKRKRQWVTESVTLRKPLKVLPWLKERLQRQSKAAATSCIPIFFCWTHNYLLRLKKHLTSQLLSFWSMCMTDTGQSDDNSNNQVSILIQRSYSTRSFVE